MLASLIGHHGWYNGRMNSNSPYHPSPSSACDAPTDFAPTHQSDWIRVPPDSCVRVLLSIDVPERLLPEIRADWEQVGAAQEGATAAIASALGRLQEHVVAVSGVAVIERPLSSFADWMRQREAELAA
jgi:hypothetical protein